MDDFFARHSPEVYRLALHLLRQPQDAEEVAQDVLLRAWARRRKLANMDQPRAWLIKVTVNRCRDRIRRQIVRRRHEGASHTPPDHVQNHTPNHEHRATTQEALDRVRHAMDQMPRRQRDVLYLSAFMQMNAAEVADALGLTPGSVRVTLSRARAKLRELLPEEDPR